MASDAAADVPHARFFALALGLLVGFVTGFVVLLAHLPVDQSVVDYQARATDESAGQDAGTRFDFYEVLAAGNPAPEPVRQTSPGTTSEFDTAVSEPSVAAVAEVPVRTLVPATRVVPGSAQSTDHATLAEQDYAAIPAASIGNESYYLQTGSFRQPDAAERRRAEVLLLGLDAFIVTRQDAGGALGHRVRIGPFFDQSRLTDAKKRLRRGQMPYEIVRVTG